MGWDATFTAGTFSGNQSAEFQLSRFFVRTGWTAVDRCDCEEMVAADASEVGTVRLYSEIYRRLRVRAVNHTLHNY